MMQRKQKPLGNRNHHYWLAVTMAQRTGADMQRALDEGRISMREWAGLVERCRGCAWAEGCLCWMATQEDGCAEVPAACPNADLFRDVRAAQDA